MKLAISVTGGGVKKDQYSYIQVFIDYLSQIIDIILKLFGIVKDNVPAAETESTTGAQTEG